MNFVNPYWSEKTKLELLQKWLIVHSVIYYQLNDNLVSDQMYDGNSKQLSKLIKSNREAHKSTKWHYVFKGWEKENTTSGFNIYTKLKKCDRINIMQIAEYLVRSFGNKK